MNEVQNCWKCGEFIKTGAKEAKRDRIQTNHVNIQQDNTK